MDQPDWSFPISASGNVFENRFVGYSTLDNGTAYNDLLDGFDFFTPSARVTLVLAIDGPAVESPDHTSISGSTFAISFFDSNFNPVLSTDPDGFAGIINLNLDGTASVQNFRGSDGDSVTITALNAPPPPATRSRTPSSCPQPASRESSLSPAGKLARISTDVAKD